MTISTTQIAAQYFGIAAGVPIAVNMPVFDTTEYEVLYGAMALPAILNVDYTVTVAVDFSNFTITPLASLITKIGAGTNIITVRQKISQLTSASSTSTRDTLFTALEFSRVWRGIQEIADGLRRSFHYDDDVLTDAPILDAPIAASQMLATDATGTRIVSGGSVTDFAGAVAAAATAVASAAAALASQVAAAISAAAALVSQNSATASAAAALSSANAAIVAKMVWRSDSPWATGRNYALNDVTRSTSGLGSYICVIAHLSGASFAADLAASKWQLVAADGANGAGTGDMLKATYDPTAKNADAFAMNNMVEGAATKIMTATERTKLAGIATGAQVTGATEVAAAISAGGIKAGFVDADVIGILDSAASFVLKYVSGTTLLAYVKAYYDSVVSTLTNKRITHRTLSIASSGTPTINTDLYDAVSITALAATITSMTTNLSGTPQDFDRLTFRIKDNATARGITWGASFIAMGSALPTTTVLSKILVVGFIWDAVTSKWGCVAVSQET